jgi:hypothetical protein
MKSANWYSLLLACSLAWLSQASCAETATSNERHSSQPTQDLMLEDVAPDDSPDLINQAYILQTSDHHQAHIVQMGQANVATIDQGGAYGHLAMITQSGRGNMASIIQR